MNLSKTLATILVMACTNAAFAQQEDPPKLCDANVFYMPARGIGEIVSMNEATIVDEGECITVTVPKPGGISFIKKDGSLLNLSGGIQETPEGYKHTYCFVEGLANDGQVLLYKEEKLESFQYRY